MTEERVMLHLRVKPEAKTRMELLAAKMSTDLQKVTLSDVVRLAMARGLPILEREYR